jgi:uncharacterized protein (DUF433 family)
MNQRIHNSMIRHGRKPDVSLHDVGRAQRMIVTHPEILGGQPVFRGTRVPVHLIAELISRGVTLAELRGGYPRLTAEMIRLAPVCAAARRPSRPRRQPWHNREPAYRARRKLSDNAECV